VFAEVRPVGDGAVRVRLRNISGDPVSTTVHRDDDATDVSLPPYGIADVTLRAGT
jgi:hypothetical protein